MFSKYPNFSILKIDDKDEYNSYYRLLDKPNSDYCFSVIFSWLLVDENVYVSQINNQLLLLKYVDVLNGKREQMCYALVGSPDAFDSNTTDILIDIKSKDQNAEIIIVDSLYKQAMSDDKIRLTKDDGLCDYVYSINGYAHLDSPVYRRIRRAKNYFERNYGEDAYLKEVSIDHTTVTNIQHTWDDTYKYDNDPEKLEGEAISRIIENAEGLDTRCVHFIIGSTVEAILIFTVTATKNTTNYVDLHHARFSYRQKYINDYCFHLFAKKMLKEDIEYLNFERDAGVEGLRAHKELMKPVFMINGYLLDINL